MLFSAVEWCVADFHVTGRRTCPAPVQIRPGWWGRTRPATLCALSAPPAQGGMSPPDDHHERKARALGHRHIAGVDEVGRGPLAGPVVAAAVMLDPALVPEGLNDSKRLTARARTRLFEEILAGCAVGIGEASVAEIDRHNILRASHLAMIRALAALPGGADFALIDGNMIPQGITLPARAVVGGDHLSLSIAAASIVAKVTRDRIMVDLAQQHPGYGWEKNAGYPTAQHRGALAELGVTPHHRRSFAPVHKILCQDIG